MAVLEAKTFEIRDAMTFVACVGIRCVPSMLTIPAEAVARDQWLLRRAGYAAGSALVLFSRLDGTGPANYDPYAWTNNRTMAVAHEYIMKNWADLASGSVVDVEFILGIADAPKTSERFDG
jgi:hypothetical protein